VPPLFWAAAGPTSRASATIGPSTIFSTICLPDFATRVARRNNLQTREKVYGNQPIVAARRRVMRFRLCEQRAFSECNERMESGHSMGSLNEAFMPGWSIVVDPGAALPSQGGTLSKHGIGTENPTMPILFS
jgi:hypothetical protein